MSDFHAPAELNEALAAILGSAKLKVTTLDTLKPLSLWLINPEGWNTPLNGEQANAAFESPPYWAFCWGSGKVVADWISQHPEKVAGKTVLDFGSGSGVVAIAAAQAGASQVIACDIDPLALTACQANARLNNVAITTLDHLDNCRIEVDLLLAADVLYDPDNLPLINRFSQVAKDVIVADSRVKNFNPPGFDFIEQRIGITEPDLGEHEDVKTVRLFSLNESKAS
ncbi:MAG: class I SAM-dependent methyltransferase [bacterium]